MKEKPVIAKPKSPGLKLMMASQKLDINIIVLKYIGQAREFGLNYSNLDAFYPNANSKKILVILHKHPTSTHKKNNTSLFQCLKYNHIQQQVSYSDFFISLHL